MTRNLGEKVEDESYDAKMEVLRERIDGIDDLMVELLNERGLAAIEVGKVKKEHDKPIYVGSREKEVLEKVTEANKGGVVPDMDIERVFTLVMESSRNAQQVVLDGNDGTTEEDWPSGPSS